MNKMLISSRMPAYASACVLIAVGGSPTPPRPCKKGATAPASAWLWTATAPAPRCAAADDAVPMALDVPRQPDATEWEVKPALIM